MSTALIKTGHSRGESSVGLESMRGLSTDRSTLDSIELSERPLQQVIEEKREQRSDSLGNLQEIVAKQGHIQRTELKALEEAKTDSLSRIENDLSSSESRSSDDSNASSREDEDERGEKDNGDSDELDNETIDQVITSLNEDEDDYDLEQKMNKRLSGSVIYKTKWIGNIRCFLHGADGRPRVTIGPNWGFSCALVALATGVTWLCLKGMVNLYNRHAAWYWLVIGATTIVMGLACVLRTLLGDPGIPPEVYRLHARPGSRR